MNLKQFNRSAQQKPQPWQAKAPKADKPKLVATWYKVDGQLICKWFPEKG